jgi:hypothetical protein
MTKTVLLACAALLACTHQSSGPGQVPDDLLHIEEVAEDAYDQALVAAYAKVSSDADEIAASWQAYRARAEADGAAAADLDAMDQAVDQLGPAAAAAVDPPTVGRAANAVSAGMDELFALYDPQVPADVLALDYLGREVVLDAMQQDFGRAGTDTDAIDARWADVKQQVLDAGGSMQASDYEASIATVRSAIAATDEAQVIADANAELELVDALERVFEG